jgi:hypothetical protein
MAYLIDSTSDLITKREIDLFATKPTQTVIESGRISEVNPTVAVADSTILEFSIVTGNTEYLDLRESTLYLKAKIVRSDGTALNADAGDVGRVYPVNYPIASFFKQLEVQVGGKTIGSASNLYPYRAVLGALLEHSADAKKHQLRAGGFFTDKDNMEEVGATLATGKASNKGAVNRFNLTKYNRSFELEGRIHHEIFEQGKLLLAGVPLTLRFTPADPKFCLMSASTATDYKVKIEKATFKASIKTIAPAVHSAIQQRLRTANCKYPIERVEMRSFVPAATNTRNISEPNLCSGTIPQEIVIGLVENQAYNGSLSKNPFNFKHYNVVNVALTVNGQTIPYGQLKLDFTNRNVLAGYMTLFRGCKMWPGNISNGINLDDYVKGHALYVFNLAPDDAGNNVFQLAKTGPVSLEMTTDMDIDPALAVIVLLRYDSFFEIDEHRNVHWRQNLTPSK